MLHKRPVWEGRTTCWCGLVASPGRPQPKQVHPPQHVRPPQAGSSAAAAAAAAAAVAAAQERPRQSQSIPTHPPPSTLPCAAPATWGASRPAGPAGPGLGQRASRGFARLAAHTSPTAAAADCQRPHPAASSQQPAGLHPGCMGSAAHVLIEACVIESHCTACARRSLSAPGLLRGSTRPLMQWQDPMAAARPAARGAHRDLPRC